jgi:small subunit ribosomal protein S6
MRAYEATYILDPGLEEEKIAQAQEKYSNMITKSGGEIVSLDTWGKRRLAYEVEGFNEGFYVIMKFNADQKVADSLRKNMNIADEVIKSMLVVLN